MYGGKTMNHNADNEDNGAPVELDETMPTPAPVLEEEQSEIDLLQWQAFNKGIDAMQKLYGGIANVGHRKQWAVKAGIPIPE